MKRRTFLSRMAAGAALPALPLPAGAAAPQVSEALYAEALHLTRLWGNAVPEMYGPALGLSMEDAYTLFGRLIKDGALALPNASGFAAATAPYFNMSAGATKLAEATSKPANTLKPLTDALKEHLKEDTETSEAEELPLPSDENLA